MVATRSKDRKEVAAIIIYTIWNLWKERNRRVFNQKSAQPQQIFSMIREEAENRAMAYNRLMDEHHEEQGHG